MGGRYNNIVPRLPSHPLHPTTAKVHAVNWGVVQLNDVLGYLGSYKLCHGFYVRCCGLKCCNGSRVFFSEVQLTWKVLAAILNAQNQGPKIGPRQLVLFGCRTLPFYVTNISCNIHKDLLGI